MCNCSKPLVNNDCERIKMYANDEKKRTFIYIITNELKIRQVPKDKTPYQIAEQHNFYNDKGELEFYNVKEHPCSQ